MPLRVRWLRFQVARLSSLLLSVRLFPVLAPVIGTSTAYWSLLAAGAAANFCSDRYWSFRPDPRHRTAADRRPAAPARRPPPGRARHRRRGRAARVALAVVWLDAFLVAGLGRS